MQGVPGAKRILPENNRAEATGEGPYTPASAGPGLAAHPNGCSGAGGTSPPAPDRVLLLHGEQSRPCTAFGWDRGMLCLPGQRRNAQFTRQWLFRKPEKVKQPSQMADCPIPPFV